MLYFRALEKGIAKLPNANPEIRQKLENEARDKGWQFLHDRLTQIDPDAAKRIHPNDPQRLQRALEVYEITGKPITVLQKEAQHNAMPSRALKIILFPSDREDLKTLLKQRFEMMLEQGLIDEVKKLHARKDLNIDTPSIRSVGYRQIWEYLNGETDYNTMKKRAIVATRQLAKRQLTWLRSEHGANVFDTKGDNLSSIIPLIKDYLAV